MRETWFQLSSRRERVSRRVDARSTVKVMTDDSLMGRIEALVDEEHSLLRREESDAPDEKALEADRARLDAVTVELDRCWDLLRQRRALREAGVDPDSASVRDADTVEHYQQ